MASVNSGSACHDKRERAALVAGDAGPGCRHDAHGLVPGHEWQLRFHRPIAVRGMEVGVANTARFDLDQHLARPGGWVGARPRSRAVRRTSQRHRDRLGTKVELLMDARLQGTVDASDVLQDEFLNSVKRLKS